MGAKGEESSSGDRVTSRIKEIAYDQDRQQKSNKEMSKGYYNISSKDMEKRFSI